MGIFRLFHVARLALGLSFIAGLACFGGCGDEPDQSTNPDAVAKSKDREETERNARLKAFGPKGLGNPAKDAAAKAKGAATN
jgi:hypothetical protein